MCDGGRSPSQGHCNQHSDSSTGPGQTLARSVTHAEIVASNWHQSGIVA